MGFPRQQKARGFTLIEVIIAMSIFAIVSLLAYTGLHSVMSSKIKTEVALERLKELQMAMHTITNDFQYLSNRQAHDELGTRLQKVTTQNSEQIIAFTRSGWRNPANQVRSTLQRVVYTLDEDNNLIRTYWSHVDRADNERVNERVLIRNIETMELRFFDDQRQWHKDWPTANSLATTTPGETVNLPAAIEVILEMGDWGKIKRLIKRAPVNVKLPQAAARRPNTPNTPNTPNAPNRP